jgi:glycosyltransferase involved in cell wall biosynthesis
LLNKIHKLANIKKEIILINDGSNDGTKEILEKNKKRIDKFVNHHRKNTRKRCCNSNCKKI